MPQDIIKARLDILSSEYKEVIFSEFPSMTAEIFGEAMDLSSLQITIFENGIMLFLLLFLDRDGLVYFLITECNADPKQADDIVKSILEELSPSLVSSHLSAYQEINPEVAETQAMISMLNRVHILKNLPQNSFQFYQYIQHSREVKALLQKYVPASTEIEDQFITLLGDILLGFYKIQDTVPLLQQELGIDAKRAAQLGVEVIDFLTPLSGNSFVIPQNPHNESQDVSVFTSPTNTPEFHTMATDADAIRTSPSITTQQEIIYRSEQPDVRKSLSELPSYANQPSGNDPSSAAVAPIEPPRWGN